IAQEIAGRYDDLCLPTRVSEIELTSEQRHLRLGLGHRDARLQPAYDLQPTHILFWEKIAARHKLSLHRDRRPQIGSEQLGAVEVSRGDADHSEGLTIEGDGLPDQTRVGAEAPLPEAVTQHDYRRRARRLAFLRQKSAPQSHLRSKRRKIVLRHQQP